jgi:hypothetical protein
MSTKENKKDQSKDNLVSKLKRDPKTGKVIPPVLYGPDGKPLPPVELTETQQIQLEIEHTASEVNKCAKLRL